VAAPAPGGRRGNGRRARPGATPPTARPTAGEARLGWPGSRGVCPLPAAAAAAGCPARPRRGPGGRRGRSPVRRPGRDRRPGGGPWAARPGCAPPTVARPVRELLGHLRAGSAAVRAYATLDTRAGEPGLCAVTGSALWPPGGRTGRGPRCRTRAHWWPPPWAPPGWPRRPRSTRGSAGRPMHGGAGRGEADRHRGHRRGRPDPPGRGRSSAGDTPRGPR